MGIRRISRSEAYSKLSKEDFTTVKHEVDTLYSSAEAFGKVQAMQFFYIEEIEVTILYIYWDGERIHELTLG